MVWRGFWGPPPFKSAPSNVGPTSNSGLQGPHLQPFNITCSYTCSFAHFLQYDLFVLAENVDEGFPKMSPNSSFKSFSVVLWFKFSTNNFVFSMLWFRLFLCFVVTFSHGKYSSSENLSSAWCCCCGCCFRLCDLWIGCESFVVLLFTWDVLLERLLLLWFWFVFPLRFW